MSSAPRWTFEPSAGEQALKRHFGVSGLKGYGLDGHPALSAWLARIAVRSAVALMTVATPLALTKIVVMDFSVPDPVIVVPEGRFEHVADVTVKLTDEVSTNGFARAGAPPITTKSPAR